MNRQPIFDAIRNLIGRGFRQIEVDLIDRAIDRAMGAIAANPPRGPMPREASSPESRLGHAGRALIRKWEGCHKRRADGLYAAYPDPGSADGHPWTIGWGSTGPGIARGTVWTQQQCDERFDRDLERYAAEVERALGDAPTTPAQFDALVSFHYNTGAIRRATLTKNTVRAISLRRSGNSLAGSTMIAGRSGASSTGAATRPRSIANVRSGGTIASRAPLSGERSLKCAGY